MKRRIIAMALLFVMVVTLANCVNAVSSAELAQKLYEKGKSYGVTTADKVRVERFLSEILVTDAEANELLNYADEAVNLMKEAGVTDVKQLSVEKKNEMKNIATKAANIVNATLVFSDKEVKIYKDGKLVDTITSIDGKLTYTGNTTAIVVASATVIALVAVVVAKKKINA